MSELDTAMDEAKTQIEDAVKTFNFEDFLAGTAAVPTDKVTVYVDSATAYELERMRLEYDTSEDEGPKGMADEGDAEFERREKELIAKAEASAITLHMRAVNQPEREVIRNKVFKNNKVPKNVSKEDSDVIEEERGSRVFTEWITAAVTKFARPDGSEVGGVEHGHIQALRDVLNDSEWNKVEVMFQTLSLSQGAVDQTIDAGFPGGASTSA